MPVPVESIVKSLLNTGKYANLIACNEGASAYAFTGDHVHLNRKVFLKVYDYVEEFAEQVLREPQLLVSATQARPSCENLILVYDADLLTIDGERFVCLQMECISGPSLLAAIQKQELGQQDAVQLALGILHGVNHLHNQRLMHRDLKPSNIMLLGMTPKVTDFGSAATIPDSGILKGASRHSELYTPPEGWSATTQWTKASDIYQVGMVLYESINGPLSTDPEHYSFEKLFPRKKPRDYGHLTNATSRGIAVLCSRARLLGHGHPERPYYSKGLRRVVTAATHPMIGNRLQTAAEAAQRLSGISVPNWRQVDEDEFRAENWRGKNWIVRTRPSRIEVLASKGVSSSYRRCNNLVRQTLRETFDALERC